MIVLQCNDLYFKWLETLLMSLSNQGVSFPLFVSIYQGTPEMIARCQEIYPSAHVILDQTNGYDLPLDQHKLSDCMAVRKAYVLNEVCLTFDPDWVLMLDVDLICRKPLIRLIEGFLTKGHQVAVIKTNQALDFDSDALLTPAQISSFFNSSFIFLTRDAYHVVDQWVYFLKELPASIGFDPMVWFWDQICLYFSLRQFASELSILTLSRALVLDESYMTTSYFWASTGDDKDASYSFFVDHCDGQPLSEADAETWMMKYYHQKMYWGAYRFASHIVHYNPTHLMAIFVLGCAYFSVQRYALAQTIFKELINVEFKVAECQQYLNKMALKRL
ncbi:MAG: hypothetical protein VW397_04845 [Candidatus Margulisiibacteriota bacterium]